MGAETFVLAMLVNNQAGVLTRVSSLFGRRGFNIDSLSVGETEDSRVSRITIQTSGDDRVREQIVRQLEKLHDVRTVTVMELDRTVLRELMMVKVQAGPDQLAQVQEAVKVFRAKIVDLTPGSIIAEITGEKTKLDAFIAYLAPYGVTELCRTGLTAIGRGEYKLHQQQKEQTHGDDVL